MARECTRDTLTKKKVCKETSHKQNRKNTSNCICSHDLHTHPPDHYRCAHSLKRAAAPKHRKRTRQSGRKIANSHLSSSSKLVGLAVRCRLPPSHCVGFVFSFSFFRPPIIAGCWRMQPHGLRPDLAAQHESNEE